MGTRSRILPAAGETIPASDSEGDGGEAEGVFEGPHRERELFVLHQLARAYGTSPAVVEAVAEEYNVDDGETVCGMMVLSCCTQWLSLLDLPCCTKHPMSVRAMHSRWLC